jgi:hypothetical protein
MSMAAFSSSTCACTTRHACSSQSFVFARASNTVRARHRSFITAAIVRTKRPMWLSSSSSLFFSSSSSSSSEEKDRRSKRSAAVKKRLAIEWGGSAPSAIAAASPSKNDEQLTRMMKKMECLSINPSRDDELLLGVSALKAFKTFVSPKKKKENEEGEEDEDSLRVKAERTAVQIAFLVAKHEANVCDW